MNEFEVVYFDGQTSSGKQAILKLFPNSLRIEYQDHDYSLIEIDWFINDIHPIEILDSLYVLKHGDYPIAQIECRAEGFLNSLKEHYRSAKFLKSDPLFSLSPSKIIAATLILISVLAGAYFFVLPPFAEFVAGKVPLSTEIEMGESFYNSFTEDETKDRKLSKLVNDFAREIDFNTDYPIDITVVKNQQVNAFALPGGKIVVYEGILQKIKTPEELAALLAHEVGHIKHKHSLKSLCRSLSGYLFISIITSDLNGLATSLADNANALHNLSYSRHLEADADANAVQTLNENKLSLNGLVGLFIILKKGESEAGSYLSFLSTHPLTDERLKNAQKNFKLQKTFLNNLVLNRKFKAIAEAL